MKQMFKTGDQLFDMSLNDKGIVVASSLDSDSKLPWGIANVWWHKQGEHQMWSIKELNDELDSGNFINITASLSNHTFRDNRYLA